jgi:hypothetical protein
VLQHAEKGGRGFPGAFISSERGGGTLADLMEQWSGGFFVLSLLLPLAPT